MKSRRKSDLRQQKAQYDAFFYPHLLQIQKIALPLQRQNQLRLTANWWIRLMVRTHASHACNTSSILVSTTKTEIDRQLTGGFV